MAQPLSLSEGVSDEEEFLQRTAGKRPRSMLGLEEEEESGEELLPLLAEFFADFDCSVQDQISICRTYASHLAACQKSQKKNKK